jgi:CheY-like chemotaxis protein
MLSRVGFDKQVRQALENLYDFVRLQNLDLTKALSSGSGQSIDRSVRQLRTEILDAIEQLKPIDNVSPRAKERRPYMLLYGRYVQGMSTTELVEELMISIRQLRREHKRALQAIADLMWDKLSGQLAIEAPDELSEPPLAPAERREAAEVEAEQLISQAKIEDVSLSALVDGILTTLGPVAAKHNIPLLNQLPDKLSPVRADRVILRQALFELISNAISRTGAGQVTIEGIVTCEVSLSITAIGNLQTDTRTGISLEVSQRLIASLGGYVEIVDKSEQWQATIHLPLAVDIPILVMDDNAGMVELFRRYLAKWPYQLVEVHTAEQAIEQAREIHPKLIVLDIMMPHQDGWEVLQHLRNVPETKDVPIVICSVLNEPEIAATLGASDYLPKPVTQDALLTMVEQWCGAPPESVG